jgi:hypothetical protein
MIDGERQEHYFPVTPDDKESKRRLKLPLMTRALAEARQKALESISADDRYLLLQRHGEFVELDPQAPFGPNSSCLDELLTAVDVEGGAGDGGVRHEMDGEGGDVGRGDDAAYRQVGPELHESRLESVSENRLR